MYIYSNVTQKHPTFYPIITKKTKKCFYLAFTVSMWNCGILSINNY